MSSMLSNLGKLFLSDQEIIAIAITGTHSYRLWKKLELSELQQFDLYDYVDSLTGNFGQCSLSKHGNAEEGEAMFPEWKQEPSGWGNLITRDDEKNIKHLSVENQRYLFFEYLGIFNKEEE